MAAEIDSVAYSKILGDDYHFAGLMIRQSEQDARNTRLGQMNSFAHRLADAPTYNLGHYLLAMYGELAVDDPAADSMQTEYEALEAEVGGDNIGRVFAQPEAGSANELPSMLFMVPQSVRAARYATRRQQIPQLRGDGAVQYRTRMAGDGIVVGQAFVPALMVLLDGDDHMSKPMPTKVLLRSVQRRHDAVRPHEDRPEAALRFGDKIVRPDRRYSLARRRAMLDRLVQAEAVLSQAAEE